MNDPTLLGSSHAIQRVRSFVSRAAPSSATVLITGETGTGKEVIARALHAGSPRASGPFVAVSCAALPEGLLESELFGHERGAFTGAIASHPGRFELADGGTLFLDEIGEMTPPVQAKLLRALQDRRFERVGGTKTMTVDTRVVAATNRRLEDEVAAGRFRADLYYRLRVLQVEMPPLRERPEDLLLLWDHFVAEAAAREARPAPSTSAAARASIRSRRWEGNVRELENAAWHAVVMTASAARGDTRPAVIEEAHLPPSTSDQPAATTIVVPGMTMKEIERTAILAAVRAIGTVRGAAQALGISERKVHYKLRSYEQEMRRKPRLLLAEDDDELRWALSAALAARGYEVSAHAGGAPLLDELEHLDDDFSDIAGVVSDVRMDGLNGFDVVSRVRDAKVEAPIVLVTAFHDGETRRKAELMGTPLLAKPFSVDDLCKVLKGGSA